MVFELSPISESKDHFYIISRISDPNQLIKFKFFSKSISDNSVIRITLNII